MQPARAPMGFVVLPWLFSCSWIGAQAMQAGELSGTWAPPCSPAADCWKPVSCSMPGLSAFASSPEHSAMLGTCSIHNHPPTKESRLGQA